MSSESTPTVASLAQAGVDDLRELVGHDGPFLTALVPTPSRFDDSAHRLDVQWRNVRKQIGDDWSAQELDGLDEAVGALPHDGGASLVVVHAAGGPTFTEFLDDPVQGVTVHQDPLPRLATVLDGRQRAIPHVVVETDRTGADITAFDGGRVLATEGVEGETLHIHRGHPGGWSQRRFQQRAENTWEDNAREVSDAVDAIARRVDARLIAVSGEVRAKSLVVDDLRDRWGDRVTAVEAGDAEGISAEVVRLVADVLATDLTELAEELRTRQAAGTACVSTDATLQALTEGRVQTLLVNDDGEDTPITDTAVGDVPSGVRTVDAAIVAALRTGAGVVVVPRLAAMDGPISALLRW